jgi:hypothetical protein
MPLIKKKNYLSGTTHGTAQHVQRMEENRIPKIVLYMNLGTTRFRGRPRNRWQDEVQEDGK